jgi:hypothetical protein
MRVIVDASAGGEPDFAEEVARGLRGRGLEVEVRPPRAEAAMDTAVHLVLAGIAIRVEERHDRALLDVIGDVVRTALMHRPSLRRRARTVPVHVGESARVIEWIDVFG